MKNQVAEAQGLQARASAYFILSRMLLYPDDALFADGAEVVIKKLRETFSLLPYALRLSGRGKSIVCGNHLAEAYNRLFEYKDISVLHEFSFRAKEFQDITLLLSDLGAFYRAFGVRAEGLERHDHIATELEFMGLAVTKEKQAVEENLPEQAQTCRDIQQKFFNEHLGCFYERVAKRLKKCEHPFYASAGDALRVFLSEEKSLLAEVPA